jgi:hypothetical protein
MAIIVVSWGGESADGQATDVDVALTSTAKNWKLHAIMTGALMCASAVPRC